jgi:hypothetical protein
MLDSQLPCSYFVLGSPISAPDIHSQQKSATQLAGIYLIFSYHYKILLIKKPFSYRRLSMKGSQSVLAKVKNFDLSALVTDLF